MSNRRVLTREFKVEVVSLVTRQGLSFAETAGQLEIGDWSEPVAEVAGSIGRRKLAGVFGEGLAVGDGRGSSSSARRERSTADGTRDLKKATAFVVKESR